MKTKIAVAIPIFCMLTALITLAEAQFIAETQVIGGKTISLQSEIRKDIEGKIKVETSGLLARSIDLGDGKQGIVVTGDDGGYFCGAMNCSIWIYQKISEVKYYLLLDTIGMIVRPTTESTKGYRNLVIKGNGYDGIFTDIYVWNGKQYVEKNQEEKTKCWRSESYIPSGWCQPTESDYSGDWLSYRKKVPMPFHASGYFNGDTNKDEAWILYDENRKKWAVFIFLKQDNKKYIPIKMREMKSSDLLPQTTQINAIDPGDYETACGKGYWECSKGEPAKITLKMNGLIKGPYEQGGSSLIYWKNGKFEEVMLDD